MVGRERQQIAKHLRITCSHSLAEMTGVAQLSEQTKGNIFKLGAYKDPAEVAQAILDYCHLDFLIETTS